MKFALNTSKMSEKEAESRINQFENSIRKFISDNKSKDNDIKGLGDLIEAALNFYEVLTNLNTELSKINGVKMFLSDRMRNNLLRNPNINDWEEAAAYLSNLKQIVEMSRTIGSTRNLKTTDGKETGIKTSDIVSLILQFTVMGNSNGWYKDLKRRKGIE